MKEVTNLMINKFNIMKHGFDFMGYQVDRKQSLSFHHLIIPKRNCKALGYGDGYFEWNGAILVQSTSHDYLHTIEPLDREIFERITNEMIEENLSGKLDVENLRRIRDLLECFEREYRGKTTPKGRRLIKDDFIKKRMNI